MWVRIVIISLWSSLLGILLAIILSFLLIRYDAFGWFGPLPSFEKFENPRIEYASLLISSDNVLLGKYFRENRTSSRYEDLSIPLKEALLVTEDIRFFEHAGIDLRALLRVGWGIVTFRYAGGGSTLTMQLAQNLYRTSSQNRGSLYNNTTLGRLITKYKEWIIAIELEKNFTKKEIMAMYLNTIPFGSNAYGINTAAKTFFNKTPRELAYHEAALLVSLINAPTRYSPILNPDNSMSKRNEVLYNLYKYGRLSKKRYQEYKSLPLSLNYRVETHYRGSAPYFRAMVKNYLFSWAKERGYDLFGDGLRIYVTLDSRMQAHAEAAVRAHMSTLQENFFTHWEGANPWIDEDLNEIEGFIEDAMTRTAIYKELKARYGDDEAAITRELHKPRPMRIFSWEKEKDTIFSYMDSLRYYKHFLHTGLMSMDPHSGKIQAWVGGY